MKRNAFSSAINILPTEISPLNGQTEQKAVSEKAR